MSAQSGAFKEALAALDAAGGVASILNPEGVDLIITRCAVNVTTKATGACTVDVGVGASASTKYDTLLDGLDVGTAAILGDNIKNKGSNGKEVLAWPAGQYLTASMATGAAAGLVGSVFVTYLRV